MSAEKLPKSVVDVIKNQELKHALDSVSELLPFFSLTAKYQFAKYNELKKAGFTEQEALELCKGDLFINTKPSSPD